MTVIPKPASTVVLLDEQERVYLTKRPKTMKFLGGYYVFPGGTVDKSDKVAKSEHILNKPSSSLNLAYYIAAARELFEEIGVLLAAGKDGRVRLDDGKAAEYRKRLLNGDLSFVEMLQQEHLFFNVQQLKYFGTLVTPEGSPYRYDTRFFLAYLPKGQTPIPDAYEIEDAFWISPDEALSAYLEGRLPMIAPTILSIQSVLNYQKGKPLQLPANPNLR